MSGKKAMGHLFRMRYRLRSRLGSSLLTAENGISASDSIWAILARDNAATPETRRYCRLSV